MKKYDDLTARLLERRDRYIAAQKKRNKMLMSGAASLCVVALVGVAVWQGANRPAPPPVTNTIQATTTTTAAPTENEDTTTTTTTNTTAPTPTADGGVVATPTTVTTVAPTQTTAKPTTGKTEVPTATTAPSKTQSSATTPSKTEPSETKQTQSTVSQTKPTATQTKPTQTTPTTQPTVPPVEDDYIVVETPAGSEPGNPYMISAKIPTQCSASDEYVPISLSYGVVMVGPVKDQPLNSYMVLYLQNDEENIAILKRIDRQLFLTEYSIEILWDEDRMWAIDYIYSHTETILFPLSLCSKDSGRIWIALNKETEEGERGIEVKKQVTSICFDYVRSGMSITFTVMQ